MLIPSREGPPKGGLFLSTVPRGDCSSRQMHYPGGRGLESFRATRHVRRVTPPAPAQILSPAASALADGFFAGRS